MRSFLLFLILLLIFSPASAETPHANFTGWHLPLPAGEWRISRGPCGSTLPNNHQCGYYEDECSLDLTPLRGSMENVPVLAPQSGQVFFIGQRADAGNALLLRHPDGRVSALMHLAKIVVGPEEQVAQGQVVGYAGSTGSSGNPHLHFFIQPNAVERQCVDLQGLDTLDLKTGTATSRNRAWEDLTLPDPPSALPDFLPAQADSAKPGAVALPQRLLLAPGAILRFPIAVANPTSLTLSLATGNQTLVPARRLGDYSIFNLSLTAPSALGQYEQNFKLQTSKNQTQSVTLKYTVRPSTALTQLGVILVSPTFVKPESYSTFTSAPLLCWQESASAGALPFHFRAMLVGPQTAESGWITNTCWQPSALKAGTYYWKVFVRDAQGFMNRTNQRPYAFVIR